jgi:ABC-2 type transport system ATP-binding protein
MNVIEVHGLVKKFGPLTAVDGVSFTVGEGEIFGFLGPNGAGKTTTINMLCTLLRPTAGRAQVAGHDVVRESHAVRRAIGLVFQEPSLDDRLTAWENLLLHAVLYDVPGRERAGRMREALSVVELYERRDDPVKTFSGGMKRRLEIARGLIHHPRVLFLDEPTLGLDPQTRHRLWDYILALRERQGVTVFLTTHYMDEAEHADRIAIMDHGQIVALDTPERLKDLVGGDVVTLETADDVVAADELDGRFGLEVDRRDGRLHFEVANGERFIPELVGGLSTRILSVSLRRPTLDDVFLKLTGRRIRDEGRGEQEIGRDQLRLRVRMRGQ